jgi:hypothetical protein
MTEKTPRNRRGRSKPTGTLSHVRNLLLSLDFFLALLLAGSVGVLAAAVPAVAIASAANAIAFMGVSAAFCALSLTAMVALPGLFTPEYRYFLRQVPGGVSGALTPFAQVVLLSALATVGFAVASYVWPTSVADYSWVRGVLASLPSLLFFWSVLGAAQVVSELRRHVEREERAARLISERAAHQRGVNHGQPEGPLGK